MTAGPAPDRTDDLPLGAVVTGAAPPLPGFDIHAGRAVTLEPLGMAHAADLWRVAQGADRSFTYLRYGPFATEEAFAAHVAGLSGIGRQPFFAVIPRASGTAAGWASFCDIAPDDAAIEIGSIWFSPVLQRTRAATEAIFLMMNHAYALGYHRVVWRCNALNAASIRAASRFGFTHEGTWRCDGIVKGRRRDTAWFSLLAPEWPAQRDRFKAWLDDDNFDENGVARKPL
ncbi:RimJ/RimL family protein N-acetyltransferase [Sphingomonas sp. SORGH_AS870]|uniref:GNAT family N-acetyltransferase n=1 Tax=Sphingomonas sp. SORGH_AS_0870 TaxID=3041801 RepID=UPI0028559CD0|nr:GNAT family protein [Sphingomonas sp. SORGH_AS_0870]MDR6145865.1 RimJ/RimL family protein N-acetyltransferase [Sphingomonas sp. SORGH_AS_0870]